jgi:hypothetical protein
MPWNVLTDLSDGTLVTATHLDQLRENIEWLGALRVGNTTLANLAAAYILGGGGFSVYDTTNQTSITNHKLTFTLERFDTNGAYDTSNSRFTAPAAGLYQVGANICSNAGQTLLLVKNGSTFFQYGASGDNWTNGGFVTLLSLAASDYLELWHTSTGSATVTKSATISEFWGVKVG